MDDYFGAALAASARGVPVVGVPFEDVAVENDGMIYFIRRASAGFTSLGRHAIDQSTPSVPGTGKESDCFGLTLGAR